MKQTLRSWLLTPLILFSTGLIAGGIQPLSKPPVQVVSSSGLYIAANAGYLWRDWSSNNGTQTKASHTHSGLTWGGNIGYQFTDNLAIEMGWYQLTKPSYTVNNSNVEVSSSWLAYAAAKLIVPLCPSFSAFFKAGAGYLSDTRQDDHIARKSHHVSGIFATGLSYNVIPNLQVNLQYLYVPGSNQSNNSSFLQPQSFSATLGVSYKFSL